jgi:hypothetical protein
MAEIRHVAVVLLKGCTPFNSGETVGFPEDYAHALVKRGDALYPEDYAKHQSELAAKRAEEAAVEAKRLADKAEAQRKELERQAKEIERIRKGEDPGMPDLPDGPPASRDVKKSAVIRK